MMPCNPPMMFVSIVGHASFQTTGDSGPSTIERSYFRRWPVLVDVLDVEIDAGVAAVGAADAEVATDRVCTSTAGRVTVSIYCWRRARTGDECKRSHRRERRTKLHGIRKRGERSLNGRLTRNPAIKTFTGNITVARYVMPERAVSGTPIESWRNDVRHGLRVLAKSRGFTAVAILSLAIGVGANTAIFSVTNALLLRPLPYPNADRIAILWQRSPGLNVAQDWFSLGQYLDIATENTVFERVAAGIGASFNMTGAGRPERIDGIRVSSSMFSIFGAHAMLGRVFTTEDDQPGKTLSVILTHGFWERRFGSDRSIVGKTLTLNGNTLTVIGVMSADFSFNKEIMPAVNGIQRVDLILPLPLAASAQSKRDGEDYNVFASLKRGASIERAQAEMNGVAARMKRQYPANYPPNGGLTISVVPLINQVVGDVRLALYVLLGAVGFVLLIACGNVANLLLSRAAVREKEMAIRSAVGADRSRLLRQLLTENVLLSVMGGVAGLGVALLGIGAIRQFGPANIPRLGEIGVDGRALAFTFFVALLTAVLFGLGPALRASRVDPNAVLKEGGRGSVGTSALGLGHGQLRKILITAEVALSLVLLIGAGLLIRSYARITNASPGFNPHNVLSLRISLPGFRYKTPAMVSAFYQQLSERVRALPGVEYVGSNYQLPLSSVALAWEPIAIEGYVPTVAGNDLIIASSAYISSDYFRAMGVPLSKGRFFTEQDTKQSPEVVIVDDQLAARFWPNENPLGKRLRQGADGPWRTVVGVVGDGKEYQTEAEPPITAYFPVEQYNIASRFVVVRTRSGSDAANLTNAVASEIRRLDPELPAYDVATMDHRLYDSLARRRLSMFLLGTFAAFALILAAIGIYGVIAYWVDQRTREIGIRMALGADRRRILELIAREFLVMIAVGLAVGLGGAFALTRVMSGLLFGVSATDVMTFGLIPLVLGAIAMLATYVPARRAMRVEPIVAVRAE
jgi:predicted permease